MQPGVPLAVNKMIQDGSGRISTFPFPPNIANQLPKEMRKQILQWLLLEYIWPQIQARQPYEKKWDKLLDMARASWKIDELQIDEGTRLERDVQQKILQGNASPSRKIDVSDTIVFDAIDRHTNLNHFTSFRDGMPVQFSLPKHRIYPMENSVYSPSSRLVTSANGLLKYCADGTDFYRKHWMTSRHHYTYGISFANSEFEQQIDTVMRRVSGDQFQEVPELTKFGVTFEPISLRKLWLNTQVTAYNMQYQPCPFFFEEVPRFAIIANPYSAELNPFGYVNLQSLPNGQWLFQGNELSSWMEALQRDHEDWTFPNLGKPELNIELKWVLYPMMPLAQVPLTQESLDKAMRSDPQVAELWQQTGKEWVFDGDGTKNLPLRRWVMEMFGSTLTGGAVEMIRLQENYYPGNNVPLFGSAHMPTLDDGLYSKAIGDILEGHYRQICKAMSQFTLNKDRINDPPKKMQLNSPSAQSNTNIPGTNNMVNSMNDYENDEVIDATMTTPAYIQMLRKQAETTSKAVDSIRGEAMGSRTTASEANNTFEIAMSGISTDINLFNHDIAGNYALRVWDYLGLWADPDIIQGITGQFGFAIRPEHFAIRLDVVWDIGSTYVESITRQGNLRYILEAGRGDPSINSAYLWEALLKEWKIPDIKRIINDGGLEQQILEAAHQAELTYIGGTLVIVDPDQNHEVAKKVKLSYLKDRDSVWNTDPRFAANGQDLVRQIQLHETFIMLQMYQQMLQAQATEGLQQLQSGPGRGMGVGGMPQISSPSVTATSSGQVVQQAQ